MKFKILAVVAVTSAIFSLGAAPTGAVATESAMSLTEGPSSANEFSVREIVEGVVFSRGIVAEHLGLHVTYPSNLDQNDLARVKETERVLVDSMLTADHGKLAHAAQDVVTGDPYTIELGLAVFRSEFSSALDREFPGVSSIPIKAPRCGVVAVCAALGVAAIALGAAIAVVTFNVAGAVNMVYNQNGLWNENGVFNGKKAPDASSPTELVQNYPSLSATELVRRISETLRAE
jgi:SdpC family antimicrobial peptide